MYYLSGINGFMKKLLLLLVLSAVYITAALSQDKIVTLNHDTIDCKITRVSNTTIYFEVTNKGIRSSAKLPVNSILSYTRNEMSPVKAESTLYNNPFPRLRLGLGGGLGYLTASSKEAEEYLVNSGLAPDLAKSYYRDLRTGLYAYGDLIYLFTPSYGAGLKYKFFDTSGSVEGFFDPQDGVNLIYTTYSEQIYINYAGASLYFQQFIDKKKSFRVNSQISIGLATYRNEAEYLNGYLLLTGKNIGMDTSLGLEYFLSGNISAGADLGLFYSTIRKMKMTDGTSTMDLVLEKGNYENLSRVELSVGFRFYFLEK